MPRKPVSIDKEQFEELCKLHKCKDAILRELGIGDPRTLDGWIRRTYGNNSTFSTVSDENKEKGNTELLKTAMVMAGTHPAVMIFLLKNWMLYRDTPVDDNKSEGITNDMAEWFSNVKRDTDGKSDSEAT